ncbi:UNVERIFIED_CONTAM: hypothetical protein Sradi_4042200 [Sesamum radiatum]|uniref:DUF4283 domain-containing protein n=1 Tax=Sesamum radiatum TaxID=300843 RepID=A0AAW2PLJ3_SESRA
MDSGFNRLQSALSLTEIEDDGVVVALNIWYSDSESFELCLVGRILTLRPFHVDALKTTLLLAFNPVRGMELKPLEGNRFILKFNHIVDRNRVLEGCLWSFEKNLLVPNSINLNENPQEVNLDWAEFYIHVHGLPLSKMSKEMAKFIGDHLGRFVDVDMDTAGHVWGSHMRIRVSLNVTKPLKRVLKFCELRFATDFVDPGDATPFGPWLRATNLPTGRNNCGAAPPRSMILLCWNCQGLGNPCTVHVLGELLRAHGPSLVFLVETKCKKSRIDAIKRCFDLYGCCVESQGRSGGLALLWNKSLSVQLQSFGPHHIDVTVYPESESESEAEV